MMSLVAMYVMVSSVQAQEKFVLTTLEPSPLAELCENVMRTAYERIGIEIEIQHLPGERALDMANNGEVDGELFRNATISQSYPNLIQIPVAIAHPEIMVFTKNLTFPVEGWESLRPYKISIQRGHKTAETKTEGMDVFPGNTVEQEFFMVERGRVDVAIHTRMIGLAMLKQLNLPDIHVLGPPLLVSNVYHYVHQKHAAVVPQLTTVLQGMEEEGLLETFKEDIIKQYRFDEEE